MAANQTRSGNKQSISYIINTADHELLGHHALGVNCLAYDDVKHELVSGGRDGVISMWKPKEFSKQKVEDYDYYDKNFDDAHDIKQYITDNLDDDDEIYRLKDSITDHPIINRPKDAGNYQLANTGHLHLDWVNDIKIIASDDDNFTLASCSNDLSVKIWRTMAAHPQTTNLGYHDDYVSCLGYTGQHSSHGSELVSGGMDKKLKIWDLVKGECIQTHQSQREMGSIYAVDCFENYIVSGGPSKVISLFDRRDITKPVRHFLGHTDTVRSLRLGSKTFLSGSSDTSVRLWDMGTSRTMRSFDMHDSSVWSLYIPKSSTYENGEPSFDTFYSGDRSGLVVKTDLRASDLDPDLTGPEKRDYFNDKVNASLGVSTVVADLSNYTQGRDPAGILSIVEGDGLLWTGSAVSKDDFLTSWAIPNTNKQVLYQGIRLYKNLQLLSGTGEVNKTPVQKVSSDLERVGSSGALSITANINSDGVPLDVVSKLSHEDMNQIDEALTSPNGLDEVLGSNNDSTVGASENMDTEQSSAPEFNTNFLSIAGGASSVFTVTENKTLQIGYDKIPEDILEVLPYNNDPVQSITGSNGLIRSRLLNNRRHVATLDQNGCVYLIDIISGKLIRKITGEIDVSAGKHGDLEEAFEVLTDKLQTNESLPGWCSVQTKGGMLFITLQESNFMNCQIYSDEFADCYPEEAKQLEDKSDENKGDEGKNDDEKTSNGDEKEAVRYALGKMVLKSLFAGFVENAFNEENIEDRGAKRDALRSMAASEEEDGISNHAKTIWRTISRTITHSTESSSTNKKKKKKKDKKKKKKGWFSFGRKHKKDKDAKEADGSSSSQQSKGSDDGDNSSVDSTTKEFLDSQLKETQKKQMEGLETTDDILDWLDENGHKKEVESGEDPVPTFKYDAKMLMTVNENIRAYGNDTKTLFLTFLSHMPTAYGRLERVLPRWVARAVLLDIYPEKVQPKVGFMVIPNPKADPALETLESNKLTANALLRLDRVVAYIKEKLPPELLEGRELEMTCRGRVLTDRMTLNTVKNRIWKNSGDVQFVYGWKKEDK